MRCGLLCMRGHLCSTLAYTPLCLCMPCMHRPSHSLLLCSVFAGLEAPRRKGRKPRYPSYPIHAPPPHHIQHADTHLHTQIHTHAQAHACFAALETFERGERGRKREKGTEKKEKIRARMEKPQITAISMGS